MASKLVHDDLDVLVVGAGFAGLYQLHHLRRLGYKVKIVEAGGGLGGIWQWATYPGARVDSEVPIYQYSDEELWKGWNYRERYPDRAEILEYFKYVDQKWDLSKDIYFNTRVVSAEFDTTTNKWGVRAEGGQVFITKFLDLCVGIAAQPYEAKFKGMEQFQGVMHHSHNWPQEVNLHFQSRLVFGTNYPFRQI
jgi:cation diffusion facilitator CzcD-associated flavoprotein CzcO